MPKDKKETAETEVELQVQYLKKRVTCLEMMFAIVYGHLSEMHYSLEKCELIMTKLAAKYGGFNEIELSAINEELEETEQ
ncbi:MAG: hypothetical protein K6L81_01790 [Agarilytica sp.]